MNVRNSDRCITLEYEIDRICMKEPGNWLLLVNPGIRNEQK